MDAMLGFAAGVMIAASFWSLLEPGISLADELGKNAWVTASLGFLSGGIVLYIGDKVCNRFMKIIFLKGLQLVLLLDLFIMV